MANTSNPPPDAIPEAFKARFRARLADRANAFETALTALLQTQTSDKPQGTADAAELVFELQRLAHSLKGAARQFGFDALADEAQALETLTREAGTQPSLRNTGGFMPATQALIEHCRTLSVS